MVVATMDEWQQGISSLLLLWKQRVHQDNRAVSGPSALRTGRIQACKMQSLRLVLRARSQCILGEFKASMNIIISSLMASMEIHYQSPSPQVDPLVLKYWWVDLVIMYFSRLPGSHSVNSMNSRTYIVGRGRHRVPALWVQVPLGSQRQDFLLKAT